jgi:hypothetical protein
MSKSSDYTLPEIAERPFELVVSDLDGTLLNEQHKLTPRTVEAVKKLVEHGVQFMFATGRHYQDVYLIARQLGVPMCLITSNGARVHDQNGHVLYENHIPADLVRDVLSVSRGFDIHRNLYQQDLWLAEEPHEALLAIHQQSGFAYQLTPFDRMDHRHIDKIYFTADHETLLPLEKALLAKFENRLSITFTSPEYLEVMNFGVSKGHALQKLLALKGLSPERAVALGDGMNDKEMLRLVGHKVVMENAAPWVKALFPRACYAPANSEEGVAQYIEQVLLPLLVNSG